MLHSHMAALHLCYTADHLCHSQMWSGAEGDGQGWSANWAFQQSTYQNYNAEEGKYRSCHITIPCNASICMCNLSVMP